MLYKSFFFFFKEKIHVIKLKIPVEQQIRQQVNYSPTKLSGLEPQIKVYKSLI